MITRNDVAWFFAGVTVTLFAVAFAIQYGKKTSDDDKKE